MADDVIRPERRRMSASDVQQSDDLETNVDSMNSVQAVHRAAAAEIGNTSRFAGDPENAPVKIKGNIPPELRALMQGQSAPQEDAEVEYDTPFSRKSRTSPKEEANAPVQIARRKAAKATIGGDGGGISNQLSELLDRLKGTTHHYTSVELPSMGRFYIDSDGPSNGLLHVRPMTGEEEQILATPRFVKKGKAIDMIFANCIREKINPEQLLTIDRTYLLIYLRGISYGPKYEVEIKCPECNQKFATEVDLDSLNVNECPQDFDIDSLNDVLPKSKFNFTYRLSRGNDESLVQQYRDRKMKNFTDATDDTMAYRTSLLLQEVEGLTDRRQIQALHRNLPIADVTHIRNVINEPPFGVDTNIEINCPMCYAEFTVDLPLETNFFFPKRKKTETQAQN